MLQDKLIRAYTENKFIDVSKITTRKHIPLIHLPKPPTKLIRFTELPILSDNYTSYKQALLMLYPYGKLQSLLLATGYGDRDFISKLEALDKLDKSEIKDNLEDELIYNFPATKEKCLKIALEKKNYDFIDQLVKAAVDDQDYEFISRLVVESF
jgi:hypothetical protein